MVKEIFSLHHGQYSNPMQEKEQEFIGDLLTEIMMGLTEPKPKNTYFLQQEFDFSNTRVGSDNQGSVVYCLVNNPNNPTKQTIGSVPIQNNSNIYLLMQQEKSSFEVPIASTDAIWQTYNALEQVLLKASINSDEELVVAHGVSKLSALVKDNQRKTKERSFLREVHPDKNPIPQFEDQLFSNGHECYTRQRFEKIGREAARESYKLPHNHY